MLKHLPVFLIGFGFLNGNVVFLAPFRCRGKTHCSRPNLLRSICRGELRHSNHLSRLAPTTAWPVDPDRSPRPPASSVIADCCCLRPPIVYSALGTEGFYRPMSLQE